MASCTSQACKHKEACQIYKPVFGLAPNDNKGTKDYKTDYIHIYIHTVHDFILSLVYRVAIVL